jgi:hypothetical protein
MIIAFSGVKFAGKDTAAEGLIRSYGFKRIGLADRLKDICSHVFSICRKDMDDPSKKETAFEEPISINSEHIRDLLDLLRFDGFLFDMESTCRDICKNFIGKILTSIRDMLQTVGTDICRTYIQDDIWLCYIKSLITPAHNYVITDARFENERDYLKDLGAILILVIRDGLDSNSSHISENQLGKEEDYDVIIRNNTTVHEVQSSIALWYSLSYATKYNNKNRKKISI